MEARAGIEPTDKGLADLFSDWSILLISNGSKLIQSRLRTHIGTKLCAGISNRRRLGSDSLCVFRPQFPLHIADHPAEPAGTSASFTFRSGISFALGST